MCMDDSGTEDLHASDNETAFACHDDVVFDKCMESELMHLHDIGTAAQLDMPEDTLMVEGCMSMLYK